MAGMRLFRHASLRRAIAVTAAVLVLVIAPARAQCPASLTCLQTLLGQYLSCQDNGDDQSPCNRFAAHALASIYGITDFSIGGGQYMTANAMVSFVLDPAHGWVSIGSAEDDAALTAASEYAGQCKAVIALQGGLPTGHVAVVLPGPLQYSGAWGTKVPLSAAFKLHAPKSPQTYVCDKLSMAFTKADRASVTFYGKETGGNCGPCN